MAAPTGLAAAIHNPFILEDTLTLSGDIWVFSEQKALLAELLGAARELGGAAVAVVLGPRAEAEAALAHGARRVLWLGERPDDRLVDDYVPTLAAAVEQARPALLLIGATRRGRAVAGRLAARFNVTVLTDVMAFEQDGGGLQARHMIFGGGAVRVDRPTSALVIATVGAGVYAPAPAQESSGGEIVETAFLAPTAQMKLRERRERQVASVNLSAARRVVCSGRGVGKQEDLRIVEELARALGAELACTRPLAEGLDWLPRERYIGISGAIIKPDLYLGVGVSGQAQHAIGMSESRVVVAINKDASAPIFSQADYGIEGDLYAIVPALVKAIQEK